MVRAGEVAAIATRLGAAGRGPLVRIALFFIALAALWAWQAWLPRQRGLATMRACWGSQINWAGALEMYCKDNQVTPAERAALTFNAQLIAELIAMGYNDSEDDCPTGGWAYLQLLPQEPWITCVYHGPPKGPGVTIASPPPRVAPPSPQPLPRGFRGTGDSIPPRVQRLMQNARTGNYPR